MGITNRPRRRAATISTLSLGAALTGLCACNLPLADTPLGATSDQRAVPPGEPITGRVINPDGDIVVTLANARTAFPQNGKNTPGAPSCAYDSGTYSCATDELTDGAYRVEVTDAKWPSEGTHFVEVIVTTVKNYSPSIALSEDKKSVLLNGWAPGREVTLTVIDKNLARIVAGPVTGTPDDNGSVVVKIGDVTPGKYAFEATDGLWSPGDIDNGWDPLFLSI